MDQAMVNVRWCMSLLEGLVSTGVTELVISPGSRSTPLVIAADLHPGLHCHVLVDERSAAFFAMGMAKYHNFPVAIVCTSGSAPANWYPAVVEASQSSIPLVLLTADRPWELQACGANQSIDQIKLFGEHVRAFHALPPAEAAVASSIKLRNLARQVITESLWPDAGPVHINMPFREPLVPAYCHIQVPEVELNRPATPAVVLRRDQLLWLRESISGSRGLIVCGEGTHEKGFAVELARLAEQLNCPILSDPLSDLRFGVHDKNRVISHYSLFLSADCLIDEPDWIIRFGSMPVSKALQDYLSASSSRQFVVDHRGRWSDPLNQAWQVLHASPQVLCQQLNELDLQPAQPNWCKAWIARENHFSQPLNAAEKALPTETLLINQLLSGLPEDSLLFSGNSMTIRYLDCYAGKSGKMLRIVGNRGASGIDGNISTFLGLAAAYEGQGKPLAIMGDLAFFHDMNGLAAAKGLDAVLIVINNDGGGIFEQLPQRQHPGFEQYWRTPLNLDFRHAASLYDLPYHKLTEINEFSAVLLRALEEEGVSMIEVVTDPGESARLHQGLLADTGLL